VTGKPEAFRKGRGVALVLGKCVAGKPEAFRKGRGVALIFTSGAGGKPEAFRKGRGKASELARIARILRRWYLPTRNVFDQ
jgi:hypothetical protein